LTCGEEVKRIAFSAPLTIVKQRDKPQPDVPFQLFSPELLRGIERTIEGKGRVFLYAARRGLSPVIACIDCGHIFRCPDSNAPYSLVRTYNNNTEERWFVATSSGRRVRAADVCPHCGSWRLRERGIGIQYVYDELQAKLPAVAVTMIDQDSAPTTKKVEALVTSFFAAKTGILLGTQLAVPYLNQGVDFSAIVSLDATRAVPTWRADESLFRLLLKLRECTNKEVLVQTRSETDTLLTHAVRGATERFYDDEISLRQMLSYPPFSRFILLSWVGSLESAKATADTVKTALGITHVEHYFNPSSTPKKTLGHALVRMSHTPSAKERELLDKIKVLPPFIKVEVNPERIV
jgi:primosomal protein N'